MTAAERQYEGERRENALDQRIRIGLNRRCGVFCSLPKEHDGQHMHQDGSRWGDAK